MKQITMDFDTYENELTKEYCRGANKGYAHAFHRLVELIESDMSDETIKDIFESELDDRLYAENIIINWILAKAISCGEVSSESRQAPLSCESSDS